jgi:hypothetical protein
LTTAKIEPTDVPWIVTIPGVPFVVGIVAHGVQREITLYVAPLADADKPDAPWRKVCDVNDGVINGAIHGDVRGR